MKLLHGYVVMGRIKSVCLLVALCFLCSSSMGDIFAKDAFSAMKGRLDHMKYVAVYKQQKGLPIEDLSQERVVINRVKRKADELGLDAHSIGNFFKTQIFVAKAIQYRYRKEWQRYPERLSDAILSLDDVRRLLQVKEDEILTSIAKRLHNEGRFTDDQYDLFMSELQLNKLLKRDKMIIFESLKNINLK